MGTRFDEHEPIVPEHDLEGDPLSEEDFDSLLQHVRASGAKKGTEADRLIEKWLNEYQFRKLAGRD